MDDRAKPFLMELLSTPSPSGQEWTIQRKWIDYVKPFAQQIRTDMAGNAIAILNPEAPFKVLLAGHCDEIGLIVSRIDEQGFVYVDALGGISQKLAVGMKVDLLGYGGRLTGVVGANAQHHGGLKENFEFSDLCIDCGAKSKEEIAGIVQVGDMAVYKREPELLLGNRISGRGLDNRTGAFIVAETLRRVAERGTQVGVYAASTVNEETNLGGAYFAAAGTAPTMAIAIDVTFATDYPGSDSKHETVKLDGGPVLAKGAPINRKINRLLTQSAERTGIPIQLELTPRKTGTDADMMRFTGRGVPIALVSLPLRYMHSPVETASLNDIEQEIELLTDMIVHLTGHENLNPLDDEL
ncbi:M20/M25/M40 family metallo-hydrolase [Paenibacillus ginsengarvi]|uniref:M42 family peptidase n=1 Tax=Paenibacillus ginsengarvi TaxID=400777 RepID=A0A3B0CRB9_9BACL|nr:M20/M25/M40 family metallo-hydrolase [Paenibacillus ginsengarvi]RKN86394.1 M42 family peptidase [Paenibacillus ginsengarvi]